MDSLGHVNNTLYFRYMEEARIQWLAAFAASHGGGFASGSGPVIVNASCTFRKSLVYPGDVEVRMLLGDVGTTSVNSWYELDVGNERYADGAAKMVWIDMVSMRPVPLPSGLKEMLGAAK